MRIFYRILIITTIALITTPSCNAIIKLSQLSQQKNKELLNSVLKKVATKSKKGTRQNIAESIKTLEQLYSQWMDEVRLQEKYRMSFERGLSYFKNKPQIVTELVKTLGNILSIQLSEIGDKDKFKLTANSLTTFNTTIKKLSTATKSSIDSVRMKDAFGNLSGIINKLSEKTNLTFLARKIRHAKHFASAHEDAIATTTALLSIPAGIILTTYLTKYIQGKQTSSMAQLSEYEVIYPEDSKQDTEVILSASTEKSIETFIKKVSEPTTELQSATTGLLLSGPTGSGKSVLARQIARQLKRPLVVITAANLQGMYYGSTAKTINKLFKFARKLKQPILFIDEIESIIQKRSGSTSSSHLQEKADTTNAFLTQMTAASDQGLIVIGATNRKETIDPAAIRPGRFDYIIEIPYPDAAARRGILDNLLAKIDNDITENALVKAVDSTYGMSGAFIKSLISKTVDLAKFEHKTTKISDTILLSALNKSILQEEKRSRSFSPHLRALSLNQLALPEKIKQQLKDQVAAFKKDEKNQPLLFINYEYFPAIWLAHTLARATGAKLIKVPLSSIESVDYAFTRANSMDSALLFINNLSLVLEEPAIRIALKDNLLELNPARRIMVLAALNERHAEISPSLRRLFSATIQLGQPEARVDEEATTHQPQSAQAHSAR